MLKPIILVIYNAMYTSRWNTFYYNDKKIAQNIQLHIVKSYFSLFFIGSHTFPSLSRRRLNVSLRVTKRFASRARASSALLEKEVHEGQRRSRTIVIPCSNTRLQTSFPRTQYEGNIVDSLNDAELPVNLNYFPFDGSNTESSSRSYNTNSIKTNSFPYRRLISFKALLSA